MIKAAAAEQLPVVHPEQPGFAGITIAPAVRAAHDPANDRRNVVTVSTGDARLGSAGDLDRRDRPIAVRDRDVGPDGRPPRQGPARASARTFRHEGILGTVFTGRLLEETTVGAVPGDRPEHHRPGLDHRVRVATSSTRPTRSPTASRSATSGSSGSAEEVAPAERQVGDRFDRQRSSVQGHPAIDRVDLDRRRRPVPGERSPGSGRGSRSTGTSARRVPSRRRERRRDRRRPRRT